MLIMADRNPTCRAKTVFVRSRFLSFSETSGSEISEIRNLNQRGSCFTCFDASFDPKPDQLKEDTPAENKQGDANDYDL